MRVEVYGWGLVYLSACTDAQDEELDVLAIAVNDMQPSGVGPWTISKEKFFSDPRSGDRHPNPCMCPDREGHRHFLFSC